MKESKISELIEFTVDVGLSDHDALRVGLGTTSTVTVTVLATTDTDALLVACQMASIRGRMPVSATVTQVAA